MNRSVEINGIEFITTREAAKVANYSNDYISKLAREGRVKGMQLGRQWFVDPVSLTNFLEQTKVEKEVRSQQLREERALERKAREAKPEDIPAIKDGEARTHQSVVAATQAFLILAASFLAASAFWVSNSLVAEWSTSPSEEVPSQLAQVPPSPPAAPNASAPATDTDEPKALVARSAETRIATSGYLLLSPDATGEEAASLKALFSDDVVVEYADDHTGTVTPRFKDGYGTGVRFIEVPVNRRDQ